MRLLATLLILLIAGTNLNASITRSIANNLLPVSLSDSSIPAATLNGSKIYLSDEITNREFWANILSRDTVIFSYFAKRSKDPTLIFISEIKSGNSGYIFRVVSRPESINQKIEQLLAIGYVYYRVKTTIDVNPIRIRIISFEYESLEI